MSKHDSLASQLDQIISSVLLPMEERRVDIIDPAMVAHAVDSQIDPDGLAPALKTYASIMQIRSRVRQTLAARHDPVKKAEQYAMGESDDLFGDVLQPFYPVKRASGDELKPVYIRRELLTDKDVAAICSRMEKAGQALIRHVDALKAWSASFAKSA